MNIKSLMVVVSALVLSTNVDASLLTYEFTGQFHSTSSLFNSGDTFSGSYTFETTAVGLAHPDPSLDTQTLAIHSSLPGTSWNLTVFSSSVTDFSMTGSTGWINVGDDASLGDRYIANLNSAGTGALPGGLTGWMQFDLQDSFGYGADMLSSGSVSVIPDLSLAHYAGGRFVISGDSSGCTQCGVTLTSLNVSAVPVPAAAWLFGSGLIGLIGIARRKRA